MSKLYIVGTPIGNLKDITLNALDVLKKVDIIACEDTRKSIKLLNHYNIKKTLISFYDQNEKRRTEILIQYLKEGKNIALISDAGMPLISDPGYRLIQRIIEENIEYDVIAGPTALINALILSGLPSEKFIFLGFFPLKKSKIIRQLNQIKEFSGSIILYESPHRLLKTIKFLKKELDIDKIAVIKEMTKIYQTVIRSDIDEIEEKLKKVAIKGEFVIIFTLKN